MIQARTGWAALAAVAALLAGCGGSDDPAPVATQPAPAPLEKARAEVLATTSRAMGSVAFADGLAYLSVANTPTANSNVYTTPLPLQANSRWNDFALEACGLPAEEQGFINRTPYLRKLDSGLWLFQEWADKGPDVNPDSTLCLLKADRSGFEVRDAGLKVCRDGFCTHLAPTDLKQVGNILYANAGGERNVYASNDKGATWKVLSGVFDQQFCTPNAFEVVGDRLLVGGECPLDSAYLEAYQLSKDGLGLVSKEPIALTLPNLENRNVQFIKAIGTRVFAGVEGGMLRSDDGGKSFKFVIEHPVGEAKNYPYIRFMLAPSGKPDTLVVAGFDKTALKPYLAWSKDGGTTWIDISAILPGYSRNLDTPFGAMTTSLTEDAQGNIYVTLNEQDGQDGRLVRVTLGAAP